MPSRKSSTSVGKRKMSAASHTAVDDHLASNDANSPVHKIRAKKRATSRKGKPATSHRLGTKKAPSRRMTASKKTGRSRATSAKGRRHSTTDRKTKSKKTGKSRATSAKGRRHSTADRKKEVSGRRQAKK